MHGPSTVTFIHLDIAHVSVLSNTESVDIISQWRDDWSSASVAHAYIKLY